MSLSWLSTEDFTARREHREVRSAGILPALFKFGKWEKSRRDAGATEIAVVREFHNGLPARSHAT